MIDPKLIKDNPELVKKNLQRRNVEHTLLDEIDKLSIDMIELKKLIDERNELRAKRNELSKEIGQMIKKVKSQKKKFKYKDE